MINDTIIYWGLFLDKPIRGNLVQQINNQVLTFEYRPKEIPEQLLGTKAGIILTGYAIDGHNEGYTVKLADDKLMQYYHGTPILNITTGLNGEYDKPFNTAKLDFEKIKNDNIYIGAFGYYNKLNEIHFEKPGKVAARRLYLLLSEAGNSATVEKFMKDYGCDDIDRKHLMKKAEMENNTRLIRYLSEK